jgi:hypothetical protein
MRGANIRSEGAEKISKGGGGRSHMRTRLRFKFPDMQGKYSDFFDFRFERATFTPNTAAFPRTWGEIPYSPEQGIFRSDQGSFLSDQGFLVSVA